MDLRRSEKDGLIVVVVVVVVVDDGDGLLLFFSLLLLLVLFLAVVLSIISSSLSSSSMYAGDPCFCFSCCPSVSSGRALATRSSVLLVTLIEHDGIPACSQADILLLSSPASSSSKASTTQLCRYVKADSIFLVVVGVVVVVERLVIVQ